ncbi:uncharacterized protein LOC143215439 isoform X1 [Lasioglossum baleicum]|uniref:uncharacterized protein LOC143215439 isoform X1 n=2 Tax=Lasioglossum baleicum TaxID=434251 RepID=UPI003FCE2F24
MDCCNYVEAYAAGGHFYQQQHYFCYDNPNPVYAGYEPAPIAAAIDNNPRYNGPVPPGYSADYVYNPKEARLRKAMREQSRELSRRSILQSAIARAGVITGPVGSAGFLDHQHRFGCVTASGLPINPPVESDRVAEPWFQSAPRPKPIHSPRMADWYGEPIDRLQVHAAGMHQRATALDKCKDPAIRNTQTSVAPGGPDCGPSFPAAGYPVDFADVNRERELRRQENMQEYGEFTDGQKWHPYQNGGGSHQHPRSSHPSQMSGILHPNVQSPSSHGHGPWGQFCHGVLPHVPTMPRSIGVRGPRHTVLLRDRLTGRHCGFTEESARMPYAPNKIDVESMRVSYSSPEHQMPRLLESSVDSMADSTATSRTRRDDEGPRWEPNTINNGISMENLTPTTQESSAPREKEPRRCVDRFEPKKKAVSKQPLPGFHQAFGSTEIGRFSRSEFFVNMVGGENGGNVEVPDTESPDVSTERISDVNNGAGSASHEAAAAVTATATTTVRSFNGDENEEADFDESSNELVAPTSIGMYCGQPTAPRWHSPHVGAIGSEI